MRGSHGAGELSRGLCRERNSRYLFRAAMASRNRLAHDAASWRVGFSLRFGGDARSRESALNLRQRNHSGIRMT